MPGSSFTVQDLATRYAVTPHTVLHWIKNGDLKALNVGRRLGAGKPRWRVTPEAIQEFEKVRTPTPSLARARRRKREVDVIQFYPE
jgi:hypothetical protein